MIAFFAALRAFLRSLPMRTKAIVIGTSSGTIILLLLAGYGYYVNRRLYLEELSMAKGRAMAVTLAVPCRKALASGDTGALEGYLADLRAAIAEQDEDGLDLAYAMVLDHEGKVVIHTDAALTGAVLDDAAARRARRADGVLVQTIAGGREGDTLGSPKLLRTTPGTVADVAVPLELSGQRFGTLRLGFLTDRAVARVLESFFEQLLFALVLAIASGLLLAAILQKAITRPVTRLAEAIGRVQEGDLATRIEINRSDEIGRLMGTFNQMLDILKERIEMEARLHEAERLKEAHERLAEAHLRLAEAHAELQQTQERLIQSEKHASLGKLVSGIAHEINNPLNSARNGLAPLAEAIAGIRAGLGDGEGGAPKNGAAVAEELADIEASARIITRGVERAVRIVTDLRSFTRVAATSRLEPVDLRAELARAAERCREEQPDAGVTIEVDVADSAAPLLGYAGLLEQVFVNLIANAAQAIAGAEGRAGGAVRVTAAAEPDDAERVRITVRDDGPGIAPADLRRIFDPFFTTKEAGKGTGLGLGIARSIVEKHGGTIDAESSLGEGTAFHVVLPRRPPAAAEEGEDATAPPPAAATATPPSDEEKPR